MHFLTYYKVLYYYLLHVCSFLESCKWLIIKTAHLNTPEEEEKNLSENLAQDRLLSFDLARACEKKKKGEKKKLQSRSLFKGQKRRVGPPCRWQKCTVDSQQKRGQKATKVGNTVREISF